MNHPSRIFYSTPEAFYAASLKWCQKARAVRFLGSHFWLLPFLANSALSLLGLAALSVLSLLGCAQKRSQLMPNMIRLSSHRIAIVPFESGNPYVSGSSLSDCFTVRILQDVSGLQVIERKDLMKILNEQKLSLTGILRPEKFSKLGSILGVDAILVGSVETLETLQSASGSLSVTVKLVEVATGRILWADRQIISHATWSAREIPEIAAILMEKAAQKMVRRMEKSSAFSRFSSTEAMEGTGVIREARLSAASVR